LRRVYPELIVVDGGDFGETLVGTTVWKTAELFKTMRGLGYDAIGIGERDLAPAFFAEIAATGAKEVLLSGNLKPAAEAGAPPFRLIQRNSCRVGIVEAVSSFLQQGQALEPKAPKAFLQAQLGALRRKKADVLVTIYHGPAKEVLELRQSFPEVDLWLLSHWTSQPLNQVQTGDAGAIVVGPGDRGREVGLITLEKTKKDGARTATFNQIILDHRIPDSPQAAPIQERFLKRSQSSVTPPPGGNFEPVQPQAQPQNGLAANANMFVGSEVCKLCHEDIYKKWHDTKHAHALETLVTKGQSQNPECLRCHTVGFGEQTGYDMKSNQPYLAGVGCEMCHGRAGDHVRADDQTNNFAKTSEATCSRCHNQETSPKFVYAEYVTRVH
jgi:hypothetical protein